MRFAAFMLAAALAAGASAKDPLVYVGTYTGPESKGIYLYRLNQGSGTLEPLGVAAEVANPSFLAIHPNKKFLYAISEVRDGVVTAFSIAADGKLTKLNSASAKGNGPAHVSVDRAGKYVLVANYGGGSVAALPIQPDGSLKEATGFVQHQGSSVNPRRQREPHAHSINASPDNRFAIAADLGTDQLLVYRLDQAKGTLEPNEPPFTKLAGGAGPRHFAFHPGGRFAYSINELNSTVSAFNWDAKKGVLTEIQSVTTLPKDFTGQNSTAEVQVHPNGKFLYGSNRGHDSIAVFAIDKQGKLTPVEHVSTQGKMPRNFGIDPSGSFLIAANQNTNNMTVFRIDAKTGKLTPVGSPVQVSKPVCVKFLVQ